MMLGADVQFVEILVPFGNMLSDWFLMFNMLGALLLMLTML